MIRPQKMLPPLPLSPELHPTEAGSSLCVVSPELKTMANAYERSDLTEGTCPSLMGFASYMLVQELLPNFPLPLLEITTFLSPHVTTVSLLRPQNYCPWLLPALLPGWRPQICTLSLGKWLSVVKRPTYCLPWFLCLLPRAKGDLQGPSLCAHTHTHTHTRLWPQAGSVRRCA